ncbi:MAG: amino acid ABC transporter permease, partial [Betaproteobacteria bacterium]|nr:amino acid ABC transporter permease [Betaproteobacteria bacterium]
MRVELDFIAVLTQWPLLLTGVMWTLVLTVVSAVLGVLLGIGCAWTRTQGSAVMRGVVGAYVELIRNTPFIVQLFFIFFGLPVAGIRL